VVAQIAVRSRLNIAVSAKTQPIVPGFLGMCHDAAVFIADSKRREFWFISPG